jgi:hypothetical protein
MTRYRFIAAVIVVVVIDLETMSGRAFDSAG